MESSIYLNVGGTEIRSPGLVNIACEPGVSPPFDASRGFDYADGTVGGIYCGGFLDRLAQPEVIAFLRESRRVLKPGGRIRIATTDLNGLIEAYAGEGWRSSPLKKHGHEWIQSPAEYLNLRFREAGGTWLMDRGELSRLARLAGLEVSEQEASGASADERLRDIERSGKAASEEPQLVMEFFKREDRVAEAPLVSIVVPAYRATYLDACLESALAQTYANTEILVLDDSPGGDIERLVQKFSKRDPRVSYHRNKPALGEAASLGKGIGLAKGDFIKPLYDDDVLLPTAVDQLLTAVRAWPDARLATGRRQPVDAGGRVLAADIGSPLAPLPCRMRGTEVIGRVLSSGMNNIGEPTCMMFRRADALAIEEPTVMTLFGRFAFGAGDITLALHLLSKGDLAYVAQPVAQVRLHPGQTQKQPGFREPALQTWDYLRTQAARLGFPLQQGPSMPSGPVDEDGKPWDEAAYLRSRPDVAAAVAQGRFQSGHQHYMLYGKNEMQAQQVAEAERAAQARQSEASAAAEQQMARYRTAEQLLSSGRAQEAVNLLQALVNEGSRLWMPYNDLGILAFQKGDRRTAKDFLAAAIERETEPGMPRVNLAKIEAADGNFEAALRALEPLAKQAAPDPAVTILIREIEALKKQGAH
ncbi:MAG TPA: glycosyltransferase [Rhodocyclaceae bacterium]